MTIDLPYYTGLILVTGVVLTPIVAVTIWGVVQITKLERRKK